MDHDENNHLFDIALWSMHQEISGILETMQQLKNWIQQMEDELDYIRSQLDEVMEK